MRCVRKVRSSAPNSNALDRGDSGLVFRAGLPLGEAAEVFIRREDAERVIEEARGDDPGVASELRIDERELETGA